MLDSHWDGAEDDPPMAAIKYFCPECGLIVKSASDMSGQSIECLGCKTVFVAQSIQPASATEARVQPSNERPPQRPIAEPAKPVPPRPPSQQSADIRPERNPEPPKPPVKVPPRESIFSTPPPPPPPKPQPQRPRPKPHVESDRPKPRRRDDDDDEIIDLEPVRKKQRWPLMIALLGVAFVMCSGAAGGIWYFLLRGDSLKHKIEAPDKAWAFRLPDAPQTTDIKGGNYEYTFSRPGRDAEFTVNVNESEEATPDEMLDLGAGLMIVSVAQKYKLESIAASPPRADTTPYEGQYPRRLFEVDSGTRGKLTVQMIVVKWSDNKSTTFIQVAIGKDISDKERQAFFKSVQIQKAAR